MADDMVTVRSDDLRAALNELGDGYTRPLQDSIDRLRAALPWEPSEDEVGAMIAFLGWRDSPDSRRAVKHHCHRLREAGYELRKVES